MAALLALLLAVPDAGVGARYEDKESVVVLTPALQLEVTIKAGFHLNDDYPINFKPDSGGAKVEKKQMTLVACAGHPENSCGVKSPVARPAKKRRIARGTVAFAACNADVCLVKKVPLAVRVER